MPMLIALSAVIQAFFIVHVYRTGRPTWWVFMILAFPVVGCLAYYFSEIFPGSHEHRSARRLSGDLVRALAPDLELRRKADALALCGSVDNKVALARECIAARMFAEAIKLYDSTLVGVHANDADLMYGLARTHLLNGTFRDAGETIARLREAHPKFRQPEVKLLQAQVLEGMNQTDAALAEYEALGPVYVGLEAKTRYGLLLERLGHLRQARGIFREVLVHATRFRTNPETERQWIEVARQHLMAGGAA